MSNFYCLPGRTGGTPDVLACRIEIVPRDHVRYAGGMFELTRNRLALSYTALILRNR